MRKINVKIKGVTPYLMHRFSGGDEKQAKPKVGTDNYKLEIEKSLYRNEGVADGIYIPASQVHGCLVEAGKSQQIIGKGKATYSKLFGAFVMVSPAMLYITPQEYSVDERSAVIQTMAAKPRVIRYRPKWDNWEISFTIEVMEDGISNEVVRSVLEFGGKYCGIGDYRPQKKGPFGRFEIVEFEVEE